MLGEPGRAQTIFYPFFLPRLDSLSAGIRVGKKEVPKRRIAFGAQTDDQEPLASHPKTTITPANLSSHRSVIRTPHIRGMPVDQRVSGPNHGISYGLAPLAYGGLDLRVLVVRLDEDVGRAVDVDIGYHSSQFSNAAPIALTTSNRRFRT